MLTPEYLQKVPERVAGLFRLLEETIIADIARRIAQSEGQVVTATAQWQAWMAQELGISIDQIQEEAARITEKSEAEIAALFEDAARRSLEYDGKILETVGGTPEELDNSPRMRDILETAKEQTKGEMRNFTQSMGFMKLIGGKAVFCPLARFYQEALDFAHLQVHSGTVSYTQAIVQAVNQLAASGLRTVDYATGHQNRVEVAVRRAVLSGVRDTSRRLARMQGDRWGITIYEISAHSGARPTHREWQGKRFDTTGTFYPTEEELTHGELADYGCRHDLYPVPSPDMPYAYSEEELRNIDPPPVAFEGKEYDAYAATQQQRKLERGIRTTKLRLSGLQAAIDAAPEEQKEELREQFAAQSVRLRRQRELYRRFSAAAGLKTQEERTQTPGFGHISGNAVSAADGQSKERNLLPEGNVSDILKPSGTKSITARSIQSIPLPEIRRLNREENKQLQKRCRQLLRYMQEDPPGTEGAVTISLRTLQELRWVKGESGKVKVPREQEPYVLIHNHPSGMTFSIKDIASCVDSPNLHIMVAVGNDGRLYSIEKLPDMDVPGLIKRLQVLLEKYPGYAVDFKDRIALVQELLKEMEQYGFSYREG